VTKNKKVPYMFSSVQRLFDAITLQALIDIEHYPNNKNTCSPSQIFDDCRSFFKKGSGYDEWKKILELEDTLYEKRRKKALEIIKQKEFEVENGKLSA
jgi:hypothetical protein